MMIANLLIALLLSFPTGTEHTVTYYWPGEDAWGTAVADQVLMANGPLPVESWEWPLCAVSRDLLDDYPYSTWLFIEGIGLRRVSDTTAAWVKDVVDIRVPERRMERHRRRVWVVWKGE